ncbi:MAG: anthranilate phosphoribosyltransferase [Rhodothermales bacterium]
MKDFLHILAAGETLTQNQAEQAMRLMMTGESEPEQMAGLLMGLRSRGETLDELVGFTRVMREYAVKVACDDPRAIDLCGTGGDSRGTFNISTAAAFVCAGAGATVAKHGNRSVSSKCGSADVLEALGVNIALRKEGVERCLREAGIAFLFAPFFHPAMRHVMPTRRKLGVRTFFNILGPLCNPAGVKHQLVGAFNTHVAERMAGILARLDAEHVLTIHAEDGLDEVSLISVSTAFEHAASCSKQSALVHRFDIRPEDHGFTRIAPEMLRGGSAKENADILRSIFDGRQGPHRDVVLLNAAYALHTSDRFESLEACFDAARESIDSGAAMARLTLLIDVSNSTPRAA